MFTVECPNLKLELDGPILTIDRDSKTYLIVGFRSIRYKMIEAGLEARALSKKDQENAWSSLLNYYLHDNLAEFEIKELAIKYNCFMDNKISYIDLAKNLRKVGFFDIY